MIQSPHPQSQHIRELDFEIREPMRWSRLVFTPRILAAQRRDRFRQLADLTDWSQQREAARNG